MRKGFTCSAFDLLHAGHIDMLKQAKEQCDYLIVGLQNDPSKDRVDKNKPVQSIVERYLQLSACKYVDEIIPYNTEEDLEDLLSILDIDVRIVGVEYKNKHLTGRTICDMRGIEIFYNRRDHNFSSSELRARMTEPKYTDPFSVCLSDDDINSDFLGYGGAMSTVSITPHGIDTITLSESTMNDSTGGVK